MASNQKNDQNNDNIGQWIGIFIAFCIWWPLGIILAAVKVYKSYEARQSSRSRDKWSQASQPWQQTQDSYGQRQQTWSANSQRRQTKDDYQPQPEPQATWQKPAQPADEAKRQRRISKLISPKVGRWLFTGGSITLAAGIFFGILDLIENLWMISSGLVLDLISELNGFFFLMAVGGVLMYVGTRKVKKARKYREYFAMIGNQNAVSLRQLSNATSTEFQDLCDDLTLLLDKGAFGPSAYLDLSSQYLILNAQGAKEVEDRAKAAAKAAADAAARQAQEEDPSAALLKEIRRVNDQIPDPHLSAQINRIEEITRQILQYQKNHPEKAPQLHSFLSYYLPTTLKILNAYAEMERQSIQGRNITETRLRIEKMMDKVVSGFEAQLDQLYAGDRMDITSDISVLEQMMAQDGLTSDFDLGGMAAQSKES